MEKAATNSILKEALNGCDFVCRRGPLSRIAASPYSKSGEFDEGQRIICTKYKGKLIFFVNFLAQNFIFCRNLFYARIW
jgi:hypothetical protein